MYSVKCRTSNLDAILYHIEVTLIGRKLAGESGGFLGLGIADMIAKNSSGDEPPSNTHLLSKSHSN